LDEPAGVGEEPVDGLAGAVFGGDGRGREGSKGPRRSTAATSLARKAGPSPPFANCASGFGMTGREIGRRRI